MTTDEIQKHLLKQIHTVPKEFESRGIADIPNFYFRDDALLLWDAMHEYVSELMNLTYSTDEEVVKDEELTDFTTEVSKHKKRKRFLNFLQVCY